MTTDFEEYKNTVGAVYTESKFFDSLGREMESAVCEFCQKTKPIRIWLSPDFSTGRPKDNYHVLMHDYYKEGKHYFVCNDCNKEMNR